MTNIINMNFHSKIKITLEFIRNLLNEHSEGLNKEWIKIDELSRFIYSSVPKSIMVSELYSYIADYLASKISYHPDFNKLASIFAVRLLHMKTSDNYRDVVEILYNNIDKIGVQNSLITDEIRNIVSEKYNEIQKEIDYDRDYYLDYFAIKTLERSYLYKIRNKKSSNGNIIKTDEIIERPQHMFMRVALGIHGYNLEKAFETYHLMSKKYFIHATPTLFNAGSPRAQMSSCFLLYMGDDINKIFDTIKEIANVSKWAGGIGLTLSEIRAKDSIIRKTNGISNGIIPLCRVLNEVARYINQGGKRNGSFAVYLETWHADIFDFINLRTNTETESSKCRDLFLALWVNDLFMKRVEENGIWSLMCPDECPGLSDKYGDDFEKLYLSYEKQKMYKKQVKALELWYHILTAQIETGTPYMMYKDASNRKSNQKNLGILKCSNLCVAPETKILTNTGYKSIGSLRDQIVQVWNGEEFSDVVVKQTGTKRLILQIKFSNGCEIRCTENHKFYDNKNIEIEAKNLTKGTKLYKYELPVIDGDQNMSYAYFNGLYNSHDYEIKSKMNIPTKYTVPYDYSNTSKLEWLSGLIDGCGKLTSEGLEINSNNDNFITEAMFLCHTLGVNPVKSNYKLLIPNYYIPKLDDLGLKLRKITGFKLESNTIREKIRQKLISEPEITVESIEYNGASDTYCFTELKKHRGTFNGIVTGQCAEIIEYVDDDATAVCNLGSLCLPKFVEIKDNVKSFNFDKLMSITKVLVRNLDIIIDKNYYPSDKTRNSNKKHRPIGVGIQGLADTYNLMGYPFDSPEAHELNKLIFESIYYASLVASNELAKELGPYESFKGSPASEGKLQYHLWGFTEADLSGRYNWVALCESIKKYGLRCSLATALMPTATTSQIMGNSESIDPYLSNIYTRTTLAGEFIVINERLVEDLINLNLWSNKLRKSIIAMNGSIAKITEIPEHIRNIYKTAFEIKLKSIVQQSIDRGKFVDQSQSMNLYMETSDFDRLSSAHFYGWKNGLKTGMYYLRSRSAVDPIKFGIDAKELQEIKTQYEVKVCKFRPGVKLSDCTSCT